MYFPCLRQMYRRRLDRDDQEVMQSYSWAVFPATHFCLARYRTLRTKTADASD